MQRQFSAGGIVFKDGKVLLIKNAAMRDPTKSYWGFPKGHLEEGESNKEAAIREIKEETGLEIEILEKVGESKYVFSLEGEKIFKVVTMFLMEYKSGVVIPQAQEILEANWFSPEEALKLLSFPNDKTLLKKSQELLG